MMKLEKFFLTVFLLVCAVGLISLLSGCAAIVDAAAPLTPGDSASPTVDPDSPVSSDDVTPAGPVHAGSGSQGSNPGQGQRGETAIIERLDILYLESFPVQVNAVVGGFLPDGCTELDGIEVERQGDTFIIHVYTFRTDAEACILIAREFEETVSLDVRGLPAGTYPVIAGDKTATVELTMDNQIHPVEECPTPTFGETRVSATSGINFIVPGDFRQTQPEGPVEIVVRGPSYTPAGEEPARAELVVALSDPYEGMTLQGWVEQVGGPSAVAVPIDLDGEAALDIADMPGAPAHTRVVIALHEGKFVTLTFTAQRADADPTVLSDQKRLAESVLRTWKWQAE